MLRTGVSLPGVHPEAPGGLAVYEAGAACGCCIGRVALRVALTRLLRDAQRGDRPLRALLVDAGAAADPQALARTFLVQELADRLAAARHLLALDPAAAALLLAEASSTPQRTRLQSQLAFADEILLVGPEGPDRAIDALRAAAPRARRIAPLE